MIKAFKFYEAANLKEDYFLINFVPKFVKKLERRNGENLKNTSELVK